MSFILFVQFHENKGDKLISCDELASKFGSAFEIKDGEARLTYAENEYPEIDGDFQDEAINSFSVSSPPKSSSFWKSLSEILKLEGAVLLFPGLEGLVYSNEATMPHLPNDMIEALPEQHRISDNQILELLENA